MANYLDENGLARLWSRIQQLVYECGCNLGYKCINDNVETDECFERAVNSVVGDTGITKLKIGNTELTEAELIGLKNLLQSEQ